jgi:hypothetical protein
MERRKFLGASLVGLSVPALSTAGGRLYGAPASVTGPVAADRDLLVLSLSRMNLGLGSSTISMMASFGQVWSDIFSDRESRDGFSTDPVKFMTDRGIPAEVAIKSKNDVDVLIACCDPNIVEAATAGDSKKFLELLRDKGIGKRFGSEISGKVRELISRDKQTFQKSMEKMTEAFKARTASGLENDIFLSLMADDVLLTEELVTEYNELLAVVGAVVAVALLATVVLYVSVALIATVEVLAAIQAVAVVHVGAAISTNGDEELPNGGPDNAVKSIGFHAARMQAYSDSYEAFKNVSKVALITGVPDASVEMVKEFISDEIDSIIDVANELGLMDLSPELKPIIVRHTKRSALLAMGVREGELQ